MEEVILAIGRVLNQMICQCHSNGKIISGNAGLRRNILLARKYVLGYEESIAAWMNKLQKKLKWHGNAMNVGIESVFWRQNGPRNNYFQEESQIGWKSEGFKTDEGILSWQWHYFLTL